MNKVSALSAAVLLIGLSGCSTEEPKQEATTTAKSTTSATKALQAMLAEAKRVPNRTGWFEVLKLPNNIYAFWEPGHVENVNSFLIIGEKIDLLYDTGMGIASLANAIQDVRQAEKLPPKRLMVVNSHNHLDHNGGNREFAEIWTANEPWAIKRLSQGVPAGEAGGFTGYWAELKPHPGLTAPAGFNPQTHFIPPYPIGQIRFLEDGESIDLGNRKFKVLRTYAHSPDGIALYDADNAIFFGGDTFYGPSYLVTDLTLLATDLERTAPLNVSWHYASHGQQLIQVMQHSRHLAVVNRIASGEGVEGTTTFAGVPLPQYSLEGVSVILAPELLLY